MPLWIIGHGLELQCPEDLAQVLDPQTSGGLLMAVRERDLASLVAHAAQLDQHIWVVGEVGEGQGVRVLS